MIEVHSIDYDGRLGACCINARASYRWFLGKVTGAERNLEIQRKIIKGTKAYATLRADLKRGCLLPPIVLAVKNVELPHQFEEPHLFVRKQVESEALEAVVAAMDGMRVENIYIIDGLQRTNAIKQTSEELVDGELEEFLNGRIRLEIWLNIPFGALAYRMLLLNGGQKPMSIKHQVEVLSMKLQEELSDIEGIEIVTTIGGGRRSRRGQFVLSRISLAFQAWLQGQPNVDVKNIVMEQLLAESAIETLGSSLKADATQREKEGFHKFFEWVVNVDLLLPEEIEFLGTETVLQGLAAAVGAAERNEILHERMLKGLERLLTDLEADPTADPIGVGEYDTLRKGIDSAKSNVGVAGREMVFRAFQEFFVSDCTKNMKECWRFAAARG